MRGKSYITKAYQNLGLPLAKEHYRRSGIYCLVNTRNYHKYVGQARCLGDRRKEHFSSLAKDRHFNQYVQNAYNRYYRAFIFVVLEFCDDTELDDKEQYWINQLKPEYNIVRDIFAAKAKAGPYLTCDRLPDDEMISTGNYPPEGYYEKHRPDWHYWVYGGGRNPSLDIRRH